MHGFRRSIAPFALAALLAQVTTACGGVPTGPVEDQDPTGGDPQPYWEMLVTGDDTAPFTVTGTSVASPSPNVIELTASDPGGWSVVFVHDGSLPMGIPYVTDNGNLLSATFSGPSGTPCVVTPTSGGGSFALVTLGEPVDGVPTGIASALVREPCAGYGEVSFQMGFGVE